MLMAVHRLMLTRPVFLCRPMRILASYSTSDETVLTLPSEKEFKSTPVLPPLHMDTHKLVTDLTSAGLIYWGVQN